MNYLFGFIVVTFEESVASIANIYDQALSRNVFKSVWSILVMNGILLCMALPILFLILRPTLLPLGTMMFIGAVSLIEILYQVPYYMAMRYDDASVVVSLFGLEKIFIPFSAYFLAHEHLSIIQYVGYGIIILASVLLSFDRKHFKLNKAFFFMIPVVILLALQTGLEKRVLNSVEWETYYFWMLALSTPLYATLLVFSRQTRKEVRIFLKSPFQKKHLPLYGQNIATWVSQAFGVYALALLPATIVSAFGSFQSLIVHIISAEEGRWLRVKSEIFSRRRVYLCCCIGVGILLTTVV